MNPDDPRLTAYVLDELNPTTRKEIEQLMKNDSALMAEVEECRGFTTELRRQFRAEPDEALGKLRRLEIVTGAKMPVLVPPRPVWWRTRMVGSIAAACVIMGAIATLFVQQKWVSVPTETIANRSAESPWIQLPASSSRNAAPVAPSAESSVLLGSDRTQARVLASSPSALNPVRKATLDLNIGAQTKPTLMKAVPTDALRIDGSSDAARPDLYGSIPPAARPGSKGASPTATTPQARTAILSTMSTRQGLQLGRASGGTNLPRAGGQGLPSNFAGVTAGPEPAPAAPAMSPALAEFAAGTANGKRAGRAELQAAFDRELGQLQMGLSSAGDAGDLSTEILIRKAEAAGTLAALDKMGGHDERRAALREQIEQLDQAAKTNEESEKAQTQWLGRMQRLAAEIQAMPDEASNTEAYDAITDNPFLAANEQPLSTFSIDVDTASYANVRRFLNSNQLPPKGAVRIEELVNYFRYDYPPPKGDDPFSCTLEVATCPWQPEHRLVRIGLKGKELDARATAFGQSGFPDRCQRLDAAGKQVAAREGKSAAPHPATRARRQRGHRGLRRRQRLRAGTDTGQGKGSRCARSPGCGRFDQWRRGYSARLRFGPAGASSKAAPIASSC